MDRNGYNESLFGNEKKCQITGQYNCDLVRHEVFFGTANRKLSKEWGCWAYLTPEAHRKVHADRKTDLELKAECQRAFETKYGHDKFMAIFGRNYL